MDQVDLPAKIVWDYLKMDQPLEKSDAVIGFGSHDLRVAERTAEIFLAGWAPIIVFAGGVGKHTPAAWNSEAEEFAKVAIDMGVTNDKILIENKSSNTGENIQFTKQLLYEKGIINEFDENRWDARHGRGAKGAISSKHVVSEVRSPKQSSPRFHTRLRKIIMVHKPYMTRRAYAALKKQWPDIDVITTSPQIVYEGYPNEEVTKEETINTMVGDLLRIKEYPAKGYQIPQEIPQKVWDACNTLLSLGYTKYDI